MFRFSARFVALVKRIVNACFLAGTHVAHALLRSNDMRQVLNNIIVESGRYVIQLINGKVIQELQQVVPCFSDGINVLIHG
jgi:hypothetical protein